MADPKHSAPGPAESAGPTEPPRMAMRDASWYDHPSQDGPIVYHVIVSPPYVAACDFSVMLVAETECAVNANKGMRCQRRACRSRWEPFDA